MLTLQVGSASDLGLTRPVNEDSLLTGRRVLAVADGMGGHAAGDVASRMVIDRLRGLDERAHLKPEDVQLAVLAANSDIVEYARSHPECAGMGSTLTGLATVTVGGSEHWAVFNVGDSRVYRCADGDLERATIDHSEVEELVLDGSITRDQARTHPSRNIVTRALGSTPRRLSTSGSCRPRWASASSSVRTGSPPRCPTPSSSR